MKNGAFLLVSDDVNSNITTKWRVEGFEKAPIKFLEFAPCNRSLDIVVQKR